MIRNAERVIQEIAVLIVLVYLPQVLEAYQIGLSALKASLSDMPLNEEQIQDTMLELEDTLEQQRDIESMLSATITTDDVAESDLEDELMSILDEEKKQKEEEGMFSFDVENAITETTRQ